MSAPFQVVFAAAATAIRVLGEGLVIEVDVGDILTYPHRTGNRGRYFNGNTSQRPPQPGSAHGQDNSGTGDGCAEGQADKALAKEERMHRHEGAFDRIFLSNVPDYTGVLPVLTELLPCLKPHRAAWLTHRALVAPPLYRDAVHYIHAHTLLPPGPLTEALCGLRRLHSARLALG